MPGGRNVRITGIETIACTGLDPEFILVRLHTDEGPSGLGQTADFRTAPVLHDLARRHVLGRDPRDLGRITYDLFTFARYHGYAGAELRAISAIDIALWDLLGKLLDQPVHRLLGGPLRDGVRVYNTCASFGEYQDGRRLWEDPVGLAGDLLDLGIGALKYAPFDRFVEPSLGTDLTDAMAEEALRPAVAIRERFGSRMQIAIEGHAKLSINAALRAAQALERAQVPVLWLEDLLHPEHAAAWRELKLRTRFPICGSERAMTRFQLHPLLEAHGIDVLMGDITWMGGISELRRCATLAEIYGVPVAPHDRSGPVNLVAAAHVLVTLPNAYLMESVRAYCQTYYPEVVTPGRFIEDGILRPPDGPGLGIELTPAFLRREDLRIERTEA
ncbi:MAG: mandelate racemase/muconate lactonizing enzyme family protein [Candidatus Dormibacteraceae bacterium]